MDTESEETKSGPAPLRLPKVDALHVTVSIGAAYLVGFVVANTHFARYQPISVDLLRGRYISAALLFAFFTVFPVAAAVAGVRAIVRNWRRMPAESNLEEWAAKRHRIVGSLVLSAFNLLFLALMVFGLETFIMSGPYSRLLFVSYVGITVVAALYILGVATATGWAVRNLPAWFTLDRYRVALLSSYFLLLHPGLFGLMVYPYVRPEFGGGAAWGAHLLAAGTGSSPVGAGVAEHRAAIVDQDDRFLYVVECAYHESVRDSLVRQPGMIPVGSVKLIRLRRLLVLPFTCRDSLLRPVPRDSGAGAPTAVQAGAIRIGSTAAQSNVGKTAVDSGSVGEEPPP